MWSCVSNNSIRILRYCRVSLPPVPITVSSLLSRSPAIASMENTSRYNHSSSSTSFANSNRSDGGGGRGRSRGRGGGGRSGGGGKDKIDALGRLLTRILRHMAYELSLNMRSDGYVKVEDLLKLDMKTFAQIPLRLHTVDEIREVVPSSVVQACPVRVRRVREGALSLK